MTADDKYYVRNSENLREPTQIQLSKTLQTSSQHFPQLVKSASDSKHFGEKDDPRSVCIFQVTHCERHRNTNV